MKTTPTRSVILGLALATAAFAADAIKLKGSDTMLELTKKWAEKYKTSHADVTLTVQGGGSGNGITALTNGAVDIAMASRPMKSGERDKLKERFSSLGFEVKTAMDGIGIYVNSANPVNELTMAQVKDIFLGNVTNWKQVGGSDAPIKGYSREASSGTHGFMVDDVLGGKEFAAGIEVVLGSAAVVKSVSGDANGIGYAGAENHPGVKALKIKKDAGSPAVDPTPANIQSKAYPISRYLYFYLKSKPDGAVKGFVDWVTGPEGQAEAKAAGFVSLK